MIFRGYEDFCRRTDIENARGFSKQMNFALIGRKDDKGTPKIPINLN